VLRIPSAALFRRGKDWMTFTVEKNRAKLTRVSIDHSNGDFAELKNWLVEGQRVILYPADTIEDGASVRIGSNHNRTRALLRSRRVPGARLSNAVANCLSVSEALAPVRRGAVVPIIPTSLREGACSSKGPRAPLK
jgi:hypothetical protein